MARRAVRGSRQQQQQQQAAGQRRFLSKGKNKSQKTGSFCLSAVCRLLLLCALLSRSLPLLRIPALFECAAAFVWGAAQSQQNNKVNCQRCLLRKKGTHKLVHIQIKQ